VFKDAVEVLPPFERPPTKELLQLAILLPPEKRGKVSFKARFQKFSMIPEGVRL
jgi:hypothetical protein